MLLKLTEANDRPVYINVEAIAQIRDAFIAPGHYVHSANTVNVSDQYDEPGETTIQLLNGTLLYVKEPLAEVLALIEGRDPRPARILYGKKDK